MGTAYPSKNAAGFLAVAAFVVSFVLISCGGGGGGGSSSSGGSTTSTNTSSTNTGSTTGNGPLGCSLASYSPNYDAETDPSTHIPNTVHWWNHFPVKVYFQSSPQINSQDVVTIVMNGMNAWSTPAGVTLVTQVNSSGSADVVVSFTNLTHEPGAGDTLGQTSWSYDPSTSRITSATMELMTWTGMSNAQLQDGLRRTAQHEMGHALFMGGHSTDPLDTMYPSGPDDAYTALTTRDDNSLLTAYCGSFVSRSPSREPTGPLAHATISIVKR